MLRGLPFVWYGQVKWNFPTSPFHFFAFHLRECYLPNSVVPKLPFRSRSDWSELLLLKVVSWLPYMDDGVDQLYGSNSLLQVPAQPNTTTGFQHVRNQHYFNEYWQKLHFTMDGRSWQQLLWKPKGNPSSVLFSASLKSDLYRQSGWILSGCMDGYCLNTEPKATSCLWKNQPHHILLASCLASGPTCVQL